MERAKTHFDPRCSRTGSNGDGVTRRSLAEIRVEPCRDRTDEGLALFGDDKAVAGPRKDPVATVGYKQLSLRDDVARRRSETGDKFAARE